MSAEKKLTELDQIWANEAGSFLRVVRHNPTGSVVLEFRTGPQGSVAASTCREKIELASYRAQRLADVLHRATSQPPDVSAQ